MEITKEKVLEALSHVEDPDLKKDLVTLGMIRDLQIKGKEVSFTVMLTTPACPMKDMIQKACENAIVHFVDKEASVKVKMDADVTTGKTSSIPGVKNIIAVASGKGGVGKSTVAANLAIALSETGSKVGIVDADIYGPSIPILFDVVTDKPSMTQVEGKNKMIPVEAYGVKIMSIGFFADMDQPIPWRGPMATRAMTQLFTDTHWENIDYLIVDLPPGTGDIQLSLAQNIPLSGVVIVSTPQQVALADVRKGIGMFRMEGLQVPILGIIENMAYFTPAELPENKYYIFGKNGARALAEKDEIPFLGEIPLVQSICESGDAGHPVVLQGDTPQALAFKKIAGNVAQQLAIRNAAVNEPEKEKNTAS